jgi:hypothetical protein
MIPEAFPKWLLSPRISRCSMFLKTLDALPQGKNSFVSPLVISVKPKTQNSQIKYSQLNITHVVNDNFFMLKTLY